MGAKTMRVYALLMRLLGVFWPLLFVPIVIAAIQSGIFGPYEDRAFEIGEPLAIATLVYGAIYCAFWFAQFDHAIAVVYSATLTVGGVLLWHVITNANAV